MTAFTMVETLQWINTTFLPQTPVILLLFIYTILCILLVTTSIQTIVILNVFVLFGVVVLGFFCCLYKYASERLLITTAIFRTRFSTYCQRLDLPRIRICGANNAVVSTASN